MEKFLYEDEWLTAMKKEDGLKLLDCLTREPREPRLLTLQYKGRNVLHLAMRHNWYGLVQEVLLQFKHLYNTGNKEENENTSHLLDLDVLRDLLTSKEGVNQMMENSGAGSSELDVLAMAMIQCHRAINTLLVRTISKLPDLFRDHIYEHVVVECEYVGKESVKDSTVVEDTAKPERGKKKVM